MEKDRLEKYLQAVVGGEKSGAIEGRGWVVNGVDLIPILGLTNTYKIHII